MMIEITMSFTTGHALRTYRRSLGIALKQAARLVGITVKRLRRIEAAARLRARGLVEDYEAALNPRDVKLWATC